MITPVEVIKKGYFIFLLKLPGNMPILISGEGIRDYSQGTTKKRQKPALLSSESCKAGETAILTVVVSAIA
jgi:hypothetical protein